MSRAATLMRSFCVGYERTPMYPLLKTLLPMPLLYLHVLYWTNLADSALQLQQCDLIAASAGIAAIYILDRVRPSSEDADSTYAPASAAKEYATAMWAAFAVCCLLVAACAIDHPSLWGKVLIANCCVVWYSVRVPLVGRRIKDMFPGSKVIFVALMHAWWPFFVTDTHWEVPAAQCCLFFSFVLATTFMDIKDMKADRRAGVVTIANLLGNARVRIFVICGFVCLAYASAWLRPELCIAYSCTAVVQTYLAVRSEKPGLFALWSWLMLPPLCEWLLPVLLHGTP